MAHVVIVPDFEPALAAKLGQQRQNGRARQALPKPSLPRPSQAPVEVREQSNKPKRRTFTVTRARGQDGKPVLIVTPAPGFQIARIICLDIDEAAKLCRPLVITERRRGRPANSQRGGNGVREV